VPELPESATAEPISADPTAWLGYHSAFAILAAAIVTALVVFVLGSRDPAFGSK
jgi:dipeptide/tripeptide permease